MGASNKLASVQDSQPFTLDETIPPLKPQKQNHTDLVDHPHHQGWPCVLTILFCLPLLLTSALASYYGARSLLLIIFFIEGLAVFVAVARPAMPTSDSTFLILIGSISLSLLLSIPMNSSNLVGYDVHQEFYLFQRVLATGNWDARTALLYNPAISISILPSMITQVNALDGVVIFKVVYPTLFAIVPVVLYKFYRKILSPKPAFLSVFLFMSYPAFYLEVGEIAKQEVGELLLVLAVLILFLSEKVGHRAGIVTVILLTLGLVTAHYSLAFIYLLVVTFSLLASPMSRRVVALTSLTTVVLSFVIAFLWYAQIAFGSVLVSLADFVSFTITGLVRDFLNPASRPWEVLAAVGLESVTPGFLHDAYRGTQYLVQLVLALGLIIFLRRPTKTLAERKMLSLMIVSFAFLGSAVILPYFAGSINLSRFYHIALLFISPCFAYGTRQLDASLRKVYTLLSRDSMCIRVPFSTRGLIAATILFSYLLFGGGWVWAVAMDRPTSVLFDAQRMLSSSDYLLWLTYLEKYTTSQDVFAVHWMKNLPSTVSLCGDSISRYHVLTSYGERLPETTQNLLVCDLRESYVYLNELNTLHGIGTDFGGPRAYSISGILSKLPVENRVYSNGGAIIDT